jgi:hypothetical protein
MPLRLSRIATQLERILRRPSARLIAALRDAWALLASVAVLAWALWSFVASPDLDVTYAIIPVQSTRLHAREVATSRHLVLVTLQNNGSAPIENVDLEILGVHQLERLSITSSSQRWLRDLPNDNTLVDTSGTLAPDVPTIPPHTVVQITIWCTIGDRMFGSPVTIRTNAASQRLSEVRLVGGLGSFIDRNVGILTLLTIAALLVVAMKKMPRARR